MTFDVRRVLLFSMALLLVPETVPARTWIVPEEIRTIQAAIDTAASGDSVLIGPGSYPGWVTVSEKSLTLRGAGPGLTELVPTANLASLIRIRSTGPVTCRVEDLTLRDARATFGGGGISVNGPVSLEARRLEVVNCRWVAVSTDYVSSGQGGGVSIGGGAGSVLLEDCRFAENLAPTNRANSSDGSGGAAHITASRVDVRRCTFEANVAETASKSGGGSGGALTIRAATIVIEDSDFHSNSAVFGAALWSAGSLRLVRCRFFENNVPTAAPRCGGCGGSIVEHSGPALIESCLFLRNFADPARGGQANRGSLHLAGSSGPCRVRSNTFVGNGGSPAIWLAHTASVSVELEANLLAFNPGGGIRHTLTDVHGVRCNIFWANTPEFPGSADLIGQNDNQASDPLFCEGDGSVAGGGPATPTVRANSPCVLKGQGHPESCGRIGLVTVDCAARFILPTTWSAIKALFR
jgi:hypothetical protein